MNRFAYLTTGLAIKTMSNLSRATIRLHGEKNLPQGACIYVINHFTRLETFLMPYLIFQLNRKPVWSLAAAKLFDTPFGNYLQKVGAVSTSNPDRDRLMVKTLLTGEADWIVFPEGRMVKNKKIFEKGRFIVSHAGGKHPPHTGAATLALRTEFYRQRLLRLLEDAPDEAQRLLELFDISSGEHISRQKTFIVPVNLTYYPIRAKENILSNLAERLMEDIPERLVEEIMTEGTMLLAGVDIDIRFGQPLDIANFLQPKPITEDVCTHRCIDFDDPLPSRKMMRKTVIQIMKLYMKAIYELTTVNHDHLFAGVLTRMPAKKISSRDLKGRVYLLASACTTEPNAHLHQSLAENQIHLLTDDRFNKFKDFIEMAAQKGLISSDNGHLIKHREKFRRIADFHRVRIENPVTVMANALEPLTWLQDTIRRVAWVPRFITRRWVASHLMKKALSEFEEDYRNHYQKEVSKPKSVGRPYLINRRTRKLGIVLIHGYMAAPLEVKGLAQYLGKKGFLVYCPRLKGHGTAPEDLAKRSYGEWVTSVDEGFALVRSLCRKVVVGGFSTGAGLALDLAHRMGDDTLGLFAVCPPLKLQNLSSKLVPAVDVCNLFLRKVHLEGAQKDFVDNHPEHPNINYNRNPISGVRELERLMDAVEPKLADIRTPSLLVQSLGDPVVDPKGSRRVFELLGAEKKEYIVFNMNRHGILVGEGSEKVYKAIGDFILGLIR